MEKVTNGINDKQVDISGSGGIFKDPLNVRSIALTGLFILAIMYTLYFARAIFIPVSFAVLLNLLLAPAVDNLSRLGIPKELGAGIVLLVLIGFLSASVYFFYQPASEWVEKAPENFREIEMKLRVIKEPVEKVSEATKSVEQITDVQTEREDKSVEVKQPGLMNVLLYQT